MKKIVMKKGQGKTEELIKQSANNSGYIVCRSMLLAEAILFRAKQLGLSIPMPITYDEFINKRYRGRGIKSFLIDDVDVLLQYMTKVTISAITLTEDSKEEIGAKGITAINYIQEEKN